MVESDAKDDLDAPVDAPLSGGRDPTLWLADELMEMIFLILPFEVLWGWSVRACVPTLETNRAREHFGEATQARREVVGVRGRCDQAASACRAYGCCQRFGSWAGW